MKNSILITLLTLTFLSSTIYANTDYGIKDGSVKIMYKEDSRSALISKFEYNLKYDQVDIEAKRDIVFMQLLDANGDVIFSVPVGAKLLNVGISQYGQGIYYIKLLMDGEEEFLTAELLKE